MRAPFRFRRFLTLGVGPNTSQIFSKVGNVQSVATGVTANTTMDLTSGAIGLLFTADATNGSRVERIQVIHLGSNVASLVRLFMNNGGVTGTATNNWLIEEVGMAVNTLVQNAASVPGIFLRVPIVLPPAYRLYVTLAQAVASGYQVTAFGGSY